MSGIFGAGMAPSIAKAAITQDPSALPPGLAPQAAPRTPIVPQPDQLRRQNEALARAGRSGTLASRGAPAAGGTYANATLSGAR